ncbi:hypothetical protein HELRODRAFT_166761 [Helobdella robusta]|uniref:Uncharacterized protein n=1 Tax=Helobdella robusta TaxID=6412 RepID=T1EYH5_HELRO|nr:hypothetical protein HELRODRAFT_166761 [Helobdella robusta]ESO11737.1 hypothetical protein HELRODRAFT_166761 [Helobdella robusta]
MEALVNENENPDEFEFDDQDVESNAVVNSAAIDAKIIQQLRGLREQYDVKAKQQSAVIDAKIENQMIRMEDVTSKFDQKKINSTPVRHVTAMTIKAPAFDGITSWNIYKAQFETAAMNYGWNKRERATALVVALRGSAAEVLQTIPAENHSNYEVLVNALNLRYDKKHMKQIYRSQLRNRTQRPGESIQQLAQDIERLTLLSYPTYDPQHRKETALKKLVKAVRNSDLRQTLILADKRNLKDAVVYILHLSQQSKLQRLT